MVEVEVVLRWLGNSREESRAAADLLDIERDELMDEKEVYNNCLLCGSELRLERKGRTRQDAVVVLSSSIQWRTVIVSRCSCCRSSFVESGVILPRASLPYFPI